MILIFDLSSSFELFYNQYSGLDFVYVGSASGIVFLNEFDYAEEGVKICVFETA